MLGRRPIDPRIPDKKAGLANHLTFIRTTGMNQIPDTIVKRVADWPDLAQRKELFTAMEPNLTIEQKRKYIEEITHRWRNK